MANTSSAKKAVRKIERRTAVQQVAPQPDANIHAQGGKRALASGDQAAASQALGVAAPLMMRAAQKGIVHKNTASRKVSRLTKRVRSLAS